MVHSFVKIRNTLITNVDCFLDIKICVDKNDVL